MLRTVRHHVVYQSCRCCAHAAVAEASGAGIERDAAAAKYFTGRKHPGIIHLPPAILPRRLEQATERVLLAEPHQAVRDIFAEARSLGTMIHRRKPQAADYVVGMRARELERKYLRMKGLTYRGIAGDEHNDNAMERDNLQRRVLKQLKAETFHWQPIKFQERKTCLSYLAARLCPNFAAVARALNEVKKRAPAFQPTSVLDYGSGLGTAFWATEHIYPDTVDEYMCVDSSATMIDLAASLLQANSASDAPYRRGVSFRQVLPAPLGDRQRYDLVICAHSLLDFASEEVRLATLEDMWDRTRHVLVLVEHGSVPYHRLLMELRNRILAGQTFMSAMQMERELLERGIPNNTIAKLLSRLRKLSFRADACLESGLLQQYDYNSHNIPRLFEKGTVLAPCPHEDPCPMLERKTSCNLKVPYKLPKVLINRRENSSPISYESMSYLILQKESSGITIENAAWPRLVSDIERRRNHIWCNLCTQNARLERRVVTKSHRHLYRCTKECRGGDLLPSDDM